jgi:hypothetical protein
MAILPVLPIQVLPAPKAVMLIHSAGLPWPADGVVNQAPLNVKALALPIVRLVVLKLLTRNWIFSFENLSLLENPPQAACP